MTDFLHWNDRNPRRLRGVDHQHYNAELREVVEEFVNSEEPFTADDIKFSLDNPPHKTTIHKAIREFVVDECKDNGRIHYRKRRD